MGADATGVVEAARGLWPILLFVFLILFIVLFRPQVAALLGRLEGPRIRRGETEAQIALRESSIVIVEESEVPPPEKLSPPEEEALREAKTSPDEAAFIEMMGAYEEGKVEEGEAAYRRLQVATADPPEQVANEAWRDFLRYGRAQDAKALNRLRVLVNDHPDNATAASLLGHVLKQAGDYESAAASFQDAARVVDDARARASHLGSAALALFEGGREYDGFELLYTAISQEDDPLALSGLHRGLAELFDRGGETELQVVALERATELAPNDASLHFSVAWALSRVDTRSHLALLHYADALRFKVDHAAALNNLGVQYDRFLLPGKAVDAYSKAAAMGLTVAMGNLASKYLSEGFVDDAASLLTEAMKTGTPHERVVTVFERLKETERDEEKKQEDLLEHGRRVQTFIRRMAERAFSAGSPGDLEGLWSGSRGERLELEVAGGTLSGHFKESPKDAGLSVSGSCLHNSAVVLLRRAGGTERKGYLYGEADQATLRLMQEMPTGDYQEHELSPTAGTSGS
jgi:tetratricopeptide (TPR) repeat protein